MASAPGRRPPAKITASFIENAALHYLERFAASSAQARRVLMGKVDRSLAHWGGERDEAAALVDAVLEKLAGLGYLDDSRFAENRARSLHRRAASTRHIRAALASKGVATEDAAAALSALAEDVADPDLAAALALARRRRLGPWRIDGRRAEFRDKDLAVLTRAGFPWEAVRAVIDAESIEAAEELARS